MDKRRELGRRGMANFVWLIPVDDDPDMEAALAPDGLGIGGGADLVINADGAPDGLRR